MPIPNFNYLNIDLLKKYKNNIETNFDKAANTYEQASFIQKEIADDLISFLNLKIPNFKPSRILDLGAGTGVVSKKLSAQHPYAEFILNDLSPNMLKIAREKFQNNDKAHFIVNDAEEYHFPNSNLIISNLAFQWFIDLQKTLSKLLKSTEVLAFTTLYDGTFAQWRALCRDLDINCTVQDYPSIAHLKNYCLDSNPSQSFFMTKQYELEFENALAFMKYLKSLGANTPKVSTNKEINHLKRLVEYKTTKMKISYNVFFAILIK
jgi:malonyl-CoA O-methyltransferase